MDVACDVLVLLVLASFEGEDEEKEAAAASAGWLHTNFGSAPSQACFHMSTSLGAERGAPRWDRGE